MQLKCPPELSGAMLKTAPPLRRSPLKKETTQSEAVKAAEAAQVCSLKSASGGWSVWFEPWSRLLEGPGSPFRYTDRSRPTALRRLARHAAGRDLLLPSVTPKAAGQSHRGTPPLHRSALPSESAGLKVSGARHLRVALYGRPALSATL